MARKSKLPGYLIVLFVMGYIGYSWLIEPDPVPTAPPAPMSPPAAAPMSAARLPGYALNPSNTWPPEATTGNAQGLASDLFAVNYYVVLDGSGSMNESNCSEGKRKIEVARTALSAFARSVPAQANLGLAVFDGRGLSERLPLGPVNQDGFRGAVDQVKVNANTPLRSAVDLAYSRLLEQGRRQLGYGEYHLVIVTDGLASAGQDGTLRLRNAVDGKRGAGPDAGGESDPDRVSDRVPYRRLLYRRAASTQPAGTYLLPLGE